VPASKKYPDELRERAVRLYRESDPKPVIRHLAQQLGVHHEALRNWKPPGPARSPTSASRRKADEITTDLSYAVPFGVPLAAASAGQAVLGRVGEDDRDRGGRAAYEAEQSHAGWAVDPSSAARVNASAATVMSPGAVGSRPGPDRRG
jgi:Transposase